MKHETCVSVDKYSDNDISKKKSKLKRRKTMQ